MPYRAHVISFLLSRLNNWLVVPTLLAILLCVWHQVEAMLLSTGEVREGPKETGTRSILHLAVESRSKDTFDGVLAALRRRLTREEVRLIPLFV